MCVIPEAHSKPLPKTGSAMQMVDIGAQTKITDQVKVAVAVAVERARVKLIRLIPKPALKY